jgi:DNA polymerase-1
MAGVLTGGVVGHNVAFDMAVLAQWYPSLRELIWQAYSEGRILDTMLACRLADVANDSVADGYSLADCCKRLLGVDVEGKHGADAWRLRYRELTSVPVDKWPAAASRYAELDVTYTALLWHKVGRQPTDEFESRAAWALHLSSAWGMRCDPVAVAALERSLRDDVAQQDMILREHRILRGDGSKNMALVASLVEAELGPDSPKTATGKPKTDADTLAKCRHPALVALAESATASKLQSAFIPVLKRGAGSVIHPRYTAILKSDRVSCSEPNIQQLPRKGGVRECFVPYTGNVFCSADYAGAELVCLAQILLRLFGRSAMADAIMAGQDLHLNTAAMLLGWSYADTVAAYKAGDTAATEARQLAKALNFGIPGGLAPKTLQAYLRGFGIETSLERATECRNMWLSLYPEMDRYFVTLKAATRGGVFKITHPLTGFVRGGCEYTSGANHYFQSLLAKVAKEALWRVSVECYGALGSNTALRGSRVAAFVHDEILLESRRDVAPEAADRLATVMREASEPWMPDLRLGADPTLMSRWSKKAKTLRDQSGRLVVWEG